MTVGGTSNGSHENQVALSTGGRPVQAARAFLGPAPTGYFPQAQASSYLLGKLPNYAKNDRNMSSER